MMQATIQGFRLSRQQRRLWEHWPMSGAYLAQSVIRIEGDLDREVLRDALHRLLNRHQILYTTYQRPPGLKAPVQVIGEPPTELNGTLWQMADWRDWGATAQREALDALLRDASTDLFDLEQGPPVRFQLLTLDAARYLLVIQLPTLAADTLSLGNLALEIRQAYADSYHGNGASGDEGDGAARVQYVQFSEWQHSLLDGDDAESGLAYWRDQMQQQSPLPRLPYEMPVIESGSFTPAFWRTTLDPALVHQVEALADAHETTSATVLLACWLTLLRRLTGAGDIAVNHLYDGRSLEMLEPALGLFAQSLPLQLQIEGDEPFQELLAQVDEATLDGYEWQDYFLWDEHGDALPGSISFEFTQWPTLPRVNGLSFTIEHQQSFSERFKLQLSCAQTAESITALFYYDPAYFMRTDVARIAGYFGTLVTSAVADPTLPVNRLNLLTEAEREELLVTRNATAAHYPRAKSLHQLFAEQVACTPEHPAVRCGETQLTYGELNARANQLAHYLRRQGVTTNSCVGLSLDRSLEMVVGLLAILKAGGAYVPLNPEHPPARLAHQLAESGVALLLTDAAALPHLPDFAGQTLCLDRDGALWAEEPTTEPENTTGPDDLVYVIYTSGSTGTPKGVAVTHGNLVNYSYHIGQRLDLFTGNPLHFALVTTITADLGNTSLFPALISGGCLHLLGYEIATDGSRFAGYVAQHPIDVLKIVPSHLRALLSAQPEGMSVLPRNYLLLGGEAFSRSLRDQLAALAPSCRVFNHYGPSETTVGSLMGEVALAGEWPWPSTTVPIGCPIANTQIYILDEHQQPVPGGVAGELYIGGAGVARGYINQPERTAERFIANPFGAATAPRLYRTGDLVRYLPDNSVEFLGRVDNQVKIRGFRVELEEIEAVLADHPGVRQAVVLARREDAADNAEAAAVTEPRLVAYVVLDNAAEGTDAPTANDLMRDARAELPDYMVPSAFVLLDTVPLTANGKVDRSALPAPDQAQTRQATYVPPNTPTEEILCGIWAGVLDQPQVGVHDNFLELGGHSLLAMTIVARIRGAFGVELPLADLFNAPTVAQLAQAVDRAAQRGTDRQLPPILPVPRTRELPLSFAQQRLWFLDQLAPGNSFYNVPVAVRLQGQLNVAALEAAFAAILQRHESLRTTFRAVAGKPVQVITPQLPLHVRREDLRNLPAAAREREARRLATAEAQQPFDLAAGPLFRVALLQLDETDHVLLFTMHHIISDLQSRVVLTREFVALYTALAEGRSTSLPTPTVQYADYAYWQRQWLTGPAYEAELTWWREALAGSNHVLDLPTDHPRPALQTYNGADEALTLPADLATALVQLSRREGASLYMTLLAAFQTLLHRYTGQEDINVGTPVSGRTSAETEGMIGFFLNTLVMRTKLDGNPTFRDLLKQVRATTLAAYAHQEMPFEQLVEALQPARAMSHAPLFQVSFSTIAAPNESIDLPGLTIQPFMGESNSAKFDMALLMVESADGLTAQLEYNTDLFERATIRRFLDHFAHLLRAIVADPQARIGNLPLLPADEQAELLNSWSGRQETDTTDVPLIQQQIAAQVAATPDAVALVWGGQQLTYAELDAQANRLARYLRTQGVGGNGDAAQGDVEHIVAVSIERSPAMIVALLGILKAGGVCLPLDPTAPAERQQLILEDSGAKLLLTRAAVDAALAAPPAESANLASPIAAPDRLAYMIYTSGSTGQPKGVGITHRAIADHCRRTSQLYGLTAADRLLQFTSFSFDASLEQIFNALITGTTLVLPDADFWSTTAFAQKLVDYGLTFINIPTVYWSQLVREWSATYASGQDPLAGSNLRLAIVSGEEMPVEIVRQWQALPTGQIRLLNAYGPTETTITATVHEVTATDAERHRMPIGRPTPGKTIYILDAHGNPTPVGVAGELHIGGDHLARGYHRRPELTAARFIHDRFSGQPHARLYRTGDLARWLPDGTIEFLGRLDTQVKVRGFRIELGEIEAVLATHPAITDVTVVARQDDGAETPEHKRLVAYLVTQGERPPSVTELRDFVKPRLPAYMIPAAFVFLDALPLSPSGKVDRRALPAPEAVRPDLADAYVPPRNETETQLVAIAGDLLQLERVGVHDNFFALGGHSLLATQFMARLQEAFGVTLPLRLLFETPTVAAIALAVAAAEADDGETQAPAITPRSRAERRVKRSTIA